MPKMPEVTVHVTTEPDPKETQEHKASADMWAEQCRTLQRTLLDTQIERDALRVQMKRAQQGIGEGITRPHDGPERCPTYYDGCNCTVEVLVHNIERAKRDEARIADLEQSVRTMHADASALTVERDRYREALKIIADPSTACMSWSETVHCLRAHARNALKEPTKWRGVG